MAWIESHQSLLTHRKTLMLAELLHVNKFQVIGHLHTLWWYGLDNCDSSGFLDGASDKTIASGAGWTGKGNFAEALRQVGFISDGCLHNWPFYAGKLQDQRAKHREVMRQSRASHVPITRPSRDNLPYPTVPNPTEPNHTQPATAKAAAPEQARAIPHWVLAFQLYEQTIGTIDAHLAQKVQEALDDGWTDECQVHCFAEASEHNARNWKYVDAIRKRHKAEGCFASVPTNGTMPPTDPEAEWLAERYRRGKDAAKAGA